MARFLRLTFLGLALSVTTASVVIYGHIDAWSQRPIENQLSTRETVFHYEPGTNLSQLAHLLNAQGVVDNPLYFRLYVRFLMRNYASFQAGTYLFGFVHSPAEVVEKLIKGAIHQPVILSIAVPEGFTLKLLLSRLEAHGLGTVRTLKALVQNPDFLKRLNISGPSLEGFIYPATYNFYKKPTAEEALTAMVKNFWKNLPPHYEQDVAARGLTLSQAVTFASLIELETQADDERPLVSEVIWRRLKDKAPLGIDAAIIYGIEGYDGDLTWKHLSDSSNPYNTRVRTGLPPGPIGSPSRKSLEAVLNPAEKGYYYYVLKAGTNRHHFSRTLAEHNQAVRELVAALKAKRLDDDRRESLGQVEENDGTDDGQKAGSQGETKGRRDQSPVGTKKHP